MGALNGIRVIDFGQWVAGPLTAMLLGDQGAEVIHVDPPRGPCWNTPADATLNRGKQRVTLDLKLEEDRSIARRLIASADIVIENFRPGVMDRLGIGPQTLTREHPRLIYCSLPGFAADDPRSAMPAWEGAVAAATGTYPPSTGAGDPPRFNALPLASSYAAVAAVTAIAMALFARERDGLGQQIEVPLFGAMFLAIGASGLLIGGRPAGARPDDPWGGLFECADDGRIRLSLATPRFVRRFVEAAGRRDWIALGYLEPEKVASGTELRARQERDLLDLLRSRTADEWEALGREADVSLTRVRTSTEWVQTQHAPEAGIIVPVDDPMLGRMLQPGLAVRLEGSPGAVRGRQAPVAVHELLNHPGGFGHGGASAAPGIRSALGGIRVVDITQVLAGPTAGRTLAEFGAAVVKINNPREEGAGYHWNVHRYHTDVNRGKNSMLLDLKTREGLDLLWRLVESADVLIQNFRRDAAERLGIGYEQVRARRPDIIYGTVGMYGQGGPWADLPGYEVNAQTVSGMVARMDGAGQPFAVNDYATGLLAAFGIGLALYYRQRTGQGQLVEAALARTATLLQAVYLQSYDGKTWDGPDGSTVRGWGTLQRLYHAADGWFFLGAREDQVPSLASTPGLETTAGLDGAVLEPALEECFPAKNVSEWVGLLAAVGVAAQPVRSPREAMEDPWAVAHGVSLTRPHHGGASITTIGPPIRLSRTPVQPGRVASPPGADAAQVLESLGMRGQLDELVERQVIALE